MIKDYKKAEKDDIFQNEAFNIGNEYGNSDNNSNLKSGDDQSSDSHSKSKSVKK